MFVPSPIDNSYVPYTKRSVLKLNAGLFVDEASGKRRGGPRVMPQQQEANCTTAPPGTICWRGACDPTTRIQPVLRCDSFRCTKSDNVKC
jgi:hypothetical protein